MIRNTIKGVFSVRGPLWSSGSVRLEYWDWMNILIHTNKNVNHLGLGQQRTCRRHGGHRGDGLRLGPAQGSFGEERVYGAVADAEVNGVWAHSLKSSDPTALWRYVQQAFQLSASKKKKTSYIWLSFRPINFQGGQSLLILSFKTELEMQSKGSKV